jgi:hypothetical protein
MAKLSLGEQDAFGRARSFPMRLSRNNLVDLRRRRALSRLATLPFRSSEVPLALCGCSVVSP